MFAIRSRNGQASGSRAGTSARIARVGRCMVATRFAVAIHILLLLATEPGGQATSGRIAGSVGTNPVVIRRLAGQLARAGLLRVRRGPGGAELARRPEEITLAEVWAAMRRPGLPLLPNHAGPATGGDALGRAVPRMLRGVLDEAERTLEAHLAGVTLRELHARMVEA
jgi:DNA-binding IscR family transcriptional regulator